MHQININGKTHYFSAQFYQGINKKGKLECIALDFEKIEHLKLNVNK